MKNSLKKTLCTIMVLTLAIACVACGNTQEKNTAVAVTEVGTYKYSNLALYPFQGATLLNIIF